MSASLSEVARQARQLQREERIRLVELLLETLQEPMSSDIAQAWHHEVAERVAIYESGAMQSFPAEEVFAEAKRKAR